jgi:hypothetical protein
MKMHRTLTPALALGLIFTLEALESSTALAQNAPTAAPKVEARDRGRNERGQGEAQARTPQGVPLGAGAGALLTRPEVRDELDLKDSQKQAIDRAISDLSRRRRRGEDRAPEAGSVEDGEDSTPSVEDKAEAALTKSLDAKQKQRLRQIVLRNAGARALLRPDVISRLKMSEEQVMQIQEALGAPGEGGLNAEQQEFLQQQVQTEAPVFVNEDGSIEAMEIPRPARPRRNPSQARPLDDQSDVAEMTAAGQVLRKSQRNTFNSMLGEPFDLTRLRKPYNKDEAQKDSAAQAKTKAAVPSAADEAKKAAPSTKPARKSLRDRRKSS